MVIFSFNSIFLFFLIVSLMIVNIIILNVKLLLFYAVIFLIYAGFCRVQC